MFELHNTRYVSEEKSDMGCRSSADYCFWMFLIPNNLEQLEFKMEKNIGLQKNTGKVRKSIIFTCKSGWINNLFKPNIWFIASKDTFSYFQISNSCIAFLLQYHISKIVSLKITQPLSLYWRNNGNYGLNTKVCTLLRESWTQTG